ncbi:acetyltransferase [Colletotrichum camelliae]|nr:acetyltransferase [Colletotrichum camelliae]
MAKISIRDASTAEDDVAFIVAAFDSTLAPLAALGSGAMWGSTPFSQKDGFVEETVKDVRTSEQYQATGKGEEALRIFVAEVELEVGTEAGAGAGLRCREAGDGRRYLPVGMAFVREGWVPGHVKNQFHVEKIRQELEGRKDFVYVDVLISDFRTGGLRKGAGEALLGWARKHAVEKGLREVYLDAWAGNGGRLVRFYEKHGFSVVAEFDMTRGDGTIWPGALVKMSCVDRGGSIL